MRVMAAAVLVMESLLMGFALLIAMGDSSSTALWLGSLLSFLLFITAGLLRRKSGYIIGSLLQFGLISYGLVVVQMYFMGALFAGLWIAALYLGRKGEAIKAKLIAERDGLAGK
jgi:hypothetical protein